MKKILLPATASGIKDEVLDFAAYLAGLQRSELTGLFIEEKMGIAPGLTSFEGQLRVESRDHAASFTTERTDLIGTSLSLFKNGCADRGVHYRVSRTDGDIFANIIAHSRYSDVMVLDPSISVFGDDSIPSSLALDILHKAECPVIIAPEDFVQPGEIILAYDGGYSSAFAIKQFSLQFPSLTAKKTVVLHIQNSGSAHSDRDRDDLSDWMNMHFANYSFTELHGDPREELFKYFLQHTPHSDKMLVAGAFGRSQLSSLFRPATAGLVVKAIDIPVFITHP